MTTDIGELFARNPLKLTRADIREIISTYRAARHAFNLGAPQAGSAKALSPKQKEVKEAASKISLVDLGLDLGPGAKK